MKKMLVMVLLGICSESAFASAEQWAMSCERTKPTDSMKYFDVIISDEDEVFGHFFPKEFMIGKDRFPKMIPMAEEAGGRSEVIFAGETSSGKVRVFLPFDFQDSHTGEKFTAQVEFAEKLEVYECRQTSINVTDPKS